MLSQKALPDGETETDEMFQNAGEKRGQTLPIRVIRHGGAPTNDEATGHMRMIARPSLGLSVGKVGSVVCGCASIPMGRRCRLTCTGTPRKTPPVTRMNGKATIVIRRTHHTVCHGQKEWARDDDGDGIREVHTNTIEGLWTTARNFLRPFRGVHKKYLHHYLAMCEHKINLKRISPTFIARLVTLHRSVT